MKANQRLIIVASLFSILTFNSLNALPMNRRRLKSVKRVIMRLLSQLITKKTPITEPATTISFVDKEIGHMRVASAKIVVQDLTTQLRNSIAKEKLSFSKLSRKVKIQVSASFLEKDLQYFIDYKIKKLRFKNKVLPKVKISLQNGYIEATGQVILKKIPGNFLAFLSNKAAPFKAKFKLTTKNRKLTLKIIDGVVNGQTITQDFKTQVESWINPIWDSNKAGFTSNFDTLNVTNGNISCSGRMF